MHNDGDKRAASREEEGRRHDPLGARRAALCDRAWKTVSVFIVLAALAASVPALARADFPMASLLIYVIGMAFVTMPLLLYHEHLLKAHGEQAKRARSGAGAL